MTWKLAEAKNRLSELMNLALSVGPQTITRRDGSVVVIASEEYARLVGKKPSFTEYLAQGESFEGLDLTRDPSTMREIDL